MTNDEWLAVLETERPDHPRQLLIRRQLEAAAWERSAPMRLWKRRYALELRDQTEAKQQLREDSKRRRAA